MLLACRHSRCRVPSRTGCLSTAHGIGLPSRGAGARKAGLHTRRGVASSRQTSGHGLWWFILRGLLLLDLEYCCREQSSGSPERGWSGFFVMWSITNTGTRQTRNAGVQRKRRLNGSPTALRSSLVSYCPSDSSASCGLGLRPHNSTTDSSYDAPPVHHASHTADHDMRVRSLFVILAGSRSVPGSRSRKKWQGHNTTGEAL